MDGRAEGENGGRAETDSLGGGRLGKCQSPRSKWGSGVSKGCVLCSSGIHGGGGGSGLENFYDLVGKPVPEENFGPSTLRVGVESGTRD